MHLPSFWREHCFSVAEAADLLELPEMTLRTWLARAPFTEFTGRKIGGRVYLSALEIFFYSIVRDLAGHGVGVRLAMTSARQFAREAAEAIPADEYLVVRKAGIDSWSFEIAAMPEGIDAATLLVPLRSNAIEIIEQAASAYAKDSK